MKLYKIRNWSEWFENNRSKTVIDLTWVAIPNRHDGEHFSAIMLNKDGAEIFSAWILIVQVASRCQPRGTLLRDGGKPHTAVSLSIKTRAPAKWFEIALAFLETETDWLDVEEVAGDCQRPVSVLSASCQSGAYEGRKGMEGMEGNGMEVPPTGVKGGSEWTPTPEQIRLGKLFNRKPTTRWSLGEIKAWRKITPVDESDFKFLEIYYAASWPEGADYRRRDLATMLNNFTGEIDRARNFKEPTCL